MGTQAKDKTKMAEDLIRRLVRVIGEQQGIISRYELEVAEIRLLLEKIRGQVNGNSESGQNRDTSSPHK